MKSKKEIAELIADHTQWMLYHLDNAKRAKEVGSLQSEARSISSAAEHAAIITALKGMTS